jgi:hypothetical protein
MLLRRSFGLFVLLGLMAAVVPARLWAQDPDAPEKHGRKYKAPPATSHIEVDVVKGSNNKPIVNAAVVFHPVKDGKDIGNLEVKTNPEGKAIIDVIPTGSSVRIQVIADGFATFADDYEVKESSRTISIAMIKPQAQVSTYQDNSGKASTTQPGVQEPVRPKKTAPPANPPANNVAPATPPAGGSGPSAKLASDEDPDNE